MPSQRTAAIAHLRGHDAADTRSARIVEAARAADAPSLDQIEDEHIDDALAEPAPQTVEEALAAPVTKPVFNSHSQAFLGRLMAEERSLKETAANLRSQIDELEAQYTDVMLAESGVSAAIDAIKRGQQ